MNVNYSNCYFRMMFLTIVVVLALAVKGTSGDLVHGKLYIGSYMSAHVLLNLLNELRKRDKVRGLANIYRFFATSLLHSIIQEHECYM